MTTQEGSHTASPASGVGSPTMILTYRYRIKDKRAAKRLRERAVAVNQIWNWAAAHHRHLMDRYRAGLPRQPWPSKFDLEKLLKGAPQALDLPPDTVNIICGQFVSNRGRRARPLGFRASFGDRRALGWVPFKGRYLRFDGNRITFRGQDFRWFGERRRPLPGPVRTGAFVEDAQGRWWITLHVEVEGVAANGAGEIGIDMGLTTLATTSDGQKIDNIRPLRPWADRLAVAQRAGHKRRARAIHAKIANIRKDHLHKASTALVRANRFIAVGDVNASKLAKTKMAKSVLDAGWTSFRDMLRYKSQQAGVVFLEVNEAWTSRTCSACGTIPTSSPKGMGALGVRSWVCDDCGEPHDRDINAARNILRIGRSTAAQAVGSRRAA